MIYFKCNLNIKFDDEELTEIQQTTGRKRLFSKELRCMMYGFGDDQNPYTESVDLLEDLVIEFIAETTHRAMEIGRTGRVQVEDIVFLVIKLFSCHLRTISIFLITFIGTKRSTKICSC